MKTSTVPLAGSAGEQTKRKPVLRKGPALSFATIVTYGLVALMAVESVLGLFVEGLYPEPPWAIAALRGNDLITLVLVVPAVAVAVARAGRSTRWAFVWFGALLYGFYNFAYYSFGTSFSDVFLLHVASLTASTLAAIAFVAALDADAAAERFHGGSIERVVAGFMIFVGSALVLAWGGFSLRFAFTGALPEDVMPPEAVHLVYALDLSLLAPMFLGGGVLLWRRAPWGRILGVGVNLFGAAYLVVLEFVGGYQANAGVEGKTWLSPPAIGGASLCALSAWAMLRTVETEAEVSAGDASGPTAR